MKTKAAAVIIGGGVIGCAIAYNLARLGLDDVVLLERAQLATGATGRCGAGVRQQWGTEMNCLLARDSIGIFERLEETLQARRGIELKQQGYLLLAYSQRELDQFVRNVRLQNALGIPSRCVTSAEAKEIAPLVNTGRLMGGAFCPTDGHANPFLVTQAYAEAARNLGVEVCLRTEVTGIMLRRGRVAGVKTDRGRIETRVVVNAAGAHAPLLGAMVNLALPIRPERHQILVTEPVEPMLGPMVMSFSYDLYCQQTPHGSFLMGYGDPSEPEGYNERSSWEFLEEMAAKATWLLPPLGHLRVVRQWAGLYDLTPDRQPILGETQEVPGFFLAVGFSGHGFMIAPMVGRLIAESVVGREPSLPVHLDLGRFARGELVMEPSVV